MQNRMLIRSLTHLPGRLPPSDGALGHVTRTISGQRFAVPPFLLLPILKGMTPVRQGFIVQLQDVRGYRPSNLLVRSSISGKDVRRRGGGAAGGQI